MSVGLHTSWDVLAVPAARSALTGIRAPLPAPRSAFFALDHQGHRHFLVQVADDVEPVVLRDTRCLHVSMDRLVVGDHPEARYVDLVCTDSAQNATFSAVVSDLVTVLAETSSPETELVMRTLARWRTFWAVRPDALSRDDALGLFGELWFLSRWLRLSGLSTLQRWTASTAARHDFQWKPVSIEVKTSASSAAPGPVHRISSIDQLDDPVTGTLYLFSLQVADDALSHNTLLAIITSIRTSLASNIDASILFDQKLADSGFTPAASETASRPLRVIREQLFTVGPGFPRITRASFPSGIPAGIGDLSYSLSIAACAPWLLATTPDDPAAAFLAKP